ncbi:hypothetical protein [Sphingomonas corticis]|jgi:hypothetical protein|uniref:STAS/SEC14 domain-containing protein n=1 Tax=Sphingomonas corticis TaxID=2722791 RepID=A0ABX1CI32_9SPHN|nr:hypothetical protein [Sphingomonas corticis]NJR77638.1 hypothetical protein [Sphingomonas corticis]
MDGNFTFAVEPDRDLIRTRMAGFFDDDAFVRYVAARAAAFRQLRCGANQHLWLVDLREMKIQSQEMVTAFSTILSDPAYRSKRLGFVVATSLARMQLRRALGDRCGNGVQLFVDANEAEAWVLTGSLRAAA